MKFFIGIILLLCKTIGFSQTNYYVSPTGSDNLNNGLTAETPFRSIQKAADATNPGDNVYIMNGVYSETQNRYSIHSTVLYVSRSGTVGNFITYKNYPGHAPKILGVNSVWNCVLIRANYIKFEGVEMEGNNKNITYEQAKAMYDYYVREKPNVDWLLIGTVNTNGLSIGGDMEGFNPFHHIEVRNCKVHEFQGGGIGGSDFDYVIVEDNIVYNNAWYAMCATSGISLFHLQNFDSNNSGYKNIVRGNICHKIALPIYEMHYNQVLILRAVISSKMVYGIIFFMNRKLVSIHRVQPVLPQLLPLVANKIYFRNPIGRWHYLANKD